MQSSFEAGQRDGKELKKAEIIAILEEVIDWHDGSSNDAFVRGLKTALEGVKDYG